MIQKYRDTGIQGYRDTGITEIQGNRVRVAEILIYLDTEIHRSRDTEIQQEKKYRYSGLHRFKNAGFRDGEIQRYMDTVIHG